MWNLKAGKTNSQTRITVNFKLNSDEEQLLFKWVKENGVVGGDSSFIKRVLYEEYKRQQESK